MATRAEMFIDGGWASAQSGETFTADSPATGETIAEIPQGDREDAQRAIDAANRAADAWSRTTAFERARSCIASRTRSRNGASRWRTR